MSQFSIALHFCFAILQYDLQEKFTAQKMKFSIKDYFSICDQIGRKLPIWSHLLE